MKEDLDRYAARFGVLADKVWREKYLKEPDVTSRCASANIGVALSMKSTF